MPKCLPATVLGVSSRFDMHDGVVNWCKSESKYGPLENPCEDHSCPSEFHSQHIEHPDRGHVHVVDEEHDDKTGIHVAQSVGCLGNHEDEPKKEMHTNA